MITIRGNADGVIESVKGALERYESGHPDARIDVYRQNSVSIRVRVIDPDFAGIDKGDRHELLWGFLQDLPEDQLSEISFLLLLTPEEIDKSFANQDFENPIPSRL